jgi:YegS/Rv2252/BmrU family lipid kinase
LRRLPQVLSTLRAGGIHAIGKPTSSSGHATELARHATGAGIDLVIAAGGDGTINEVANGLIGTGTPLAILPAGTASVLAMEMRLGKDLVRAASMIPQMHPRRIAVGRFQPRSGDARHFLLMAGAGMDAQIVTRVQPDIKTRFGKLAYWLAGFESIGERLPQIEVQTEGEKICTGFALAARVRNYGGDLELARNVSLLDDSFELALFRGDTTWPFARYLTGAILGNIGSMDGVKLIRTREITLTPCGGERILVQLDGELAGELPARISIVPDALTLMTPPHLEARYR